MKRLFFGALIAALVCLTAPLTAKTPPAQVKAGKVIIVPDHHRAIQAALDSAEPGDTVFVREGTYKGAVVLREDVALIGAAAERTVLAGVRNKPVVRGAQGAAIKHFTIEGGHTGVFCANTFMTIENCVIRGNRTTGIHAIIALPVIRNNVIFRNGGSGIFCETTRSHRGDIANNVIAENRYSGIMLAGQSEVVVENNALYFNKQYGIFASDGARRSRVGNNSFYGNRNSANSVVTMDASNLFGDPGYTIFAATGYTFLDVAPDALMGRGRDRTDIGPGRRAFYNPTLKPIPAASAPTRAPEPEPGKVSTDTVKPQ
ncbi:MAG: right-handed parallel beta-helix repeat-containing protein [Chitinispirillia bacterium]|nr:right-handed parallel beta-helix repeat-containing protein [Chitinispirillia bacterium]MCL2269404.1 right-handed parallel beta-helix repeat-containing protein [Chitinispirillia bacterium]